MSHKLFGERSEVNQVSPCWASVRAQVLTNCRHLHVRPEASRDFGRRRSRGDSAEALGWTRHDALATAALDIVCGLALAEWTLRDCRAVPFTCARSGDAESLKSRWLGHILPLILFAFVNGAIQKPALRSNRAAAWYAGILLFAWIVQRLRRQFAARNVSLQFDASPPDSMATLDLSEAIG